MFNGPAYDLRQVISRMSGANSRLAMITTDMPNIIIIKEQSNLAQVNQKNVLYKSIVLNMKWSQSAYHSTQSAFSRI